MEAKRLEGKVIAAKLQEEIVAHPMPIRDGYLTLADALAVQVDPDLLRAATVVGDHQVG